MRNVLADLALESEAATALALRLARTFEADAGPAERALARVLTPAAKFWICKRGPALAAEAMEVLGGNGYVEESALPRLYREMPVNSIWEGSGNVMCLDVMRAVRREPAAVAALLDELAPARGAHPRVRRAVARPRSGAGEPLRRRPRRAPAGAGDHDARPGEPVAAPCAARDGRRVLRDAAGSRSLCGRGFRGASAGLDLAPVLARAVVSSHA